MSDTKYLTVFGFVQQFGSDKPVVSEREYNNQNIRSFTVKAATTGALVRVSLFPEFSDVEIKKGTLVFADGKYQAQTKDGKTYHNITASDIVVIQPAAKQAREVVNQNAQQSEAGPSEEVPF